MCSVDVGRIFRFVLYSNIFMPSFFHIHPVSGSKQSVRTVWSPLWLCISSDSHCICMCVVFINAYGLMVLLQLVSVCMGAHLLGNDVKRHRVATVPSIHLAQVVNIPQSPVSIRVCIAIDCIVLFAHMRNRHS